MDTLQPYLPGQYILQALDGDLLDAQGRKRLLDLMSAAGRNVDSLSVYGARAPLRWLLAALPQATPSAMASFAYDFGREVRLTAHGALSSMLMATPVVAQLVAAMRFLPLLTNTVSTHFIAAANGDGFLLLQPQTGDPLLDLFPVYYAAAALPALLQRLTGSAVKVCIHLREDRLLARHADRSEQDWCYPAAAYGLALRSVDLARPCLFADPETFQATTRICEQELQLLLEPAGPSQRVRRLLEHAQHYPQLEAMAALLHLSSSTLKRQLAQQGTSFQKLLDEARRQRALVALLDPQLSMEQIAEQLGYSDASNFTHAFKKWTGQTPALFRQQLLQGEQDQR